MIFVAAPLSFGILSLSLALELSGVEHALDAGFVLGLISIGIGWTIDRHRKTILG